MNLMSVPVSACLTGGSFDEARMLKNIESMEWLTGAYVTLKHLVWIQVL